MREMNSGSLKTVIDSIQNSSPNFMYYIYEKHQFSVPLLGTRFDVYTFVKEIAGAKVNSPCMKATPHQFALTHNSSMAWFFTDNMFE